MGEVEEARARAIALQRQAAAQAQMGAVDNRRQPNESVDQYRARMSTTTMATPAGSQEMTNLAAADMQLRPAQSSQPSTALDMANSFTAGMGRGVAQLAGLPGTVDNLITSGLERTGIMPPLPEGMDRGNPLSGQALEGYLSSATGGATDYRGQTTAGEYAGTVGEFLPAAMMPGMTARNAVQFGVVPGLASEAAGQATEGTAYEPYARAAAAILAPLAGPAGARLISPNGGADPARLAFARTLEDAGVPVSAGQRVGNQALQRRELMTRAGQGLRETQGDAFTSAALATIGESATRATPDVLDAALRRIGGEFDDVAKGVDITPTPALVTRMSEAVETFRQLTPTSGQAPAVGNILKAITQSFRNGQPISAESLLTWRSRLSKLRTSADAATRDAAQEGMEALDDAVEETLNGLGRADDVARLATAREQYRNYLAIEQAATSAGETAAYGVISPVALRSAVKAQSRRAYATGRRGDIADLARAAQGVLQRPNTSGTAENLAAAGVPFGTGGTVGAVVGSVLGGGPGAAIGAALGGAAPYAARALQASRPGQAYLANQMVTPQNALRGGQIGIPMIPYATSDNALNLPAR